MTLTRRSARVASITTNRSHSVRRLILLAVLALAGVSLFIKLKEDAKTDLDIVYGSQGIERLTYSGTVLEDLSKNPSDAFHIWHMKSTDLEGHAMTEGQYGWGESNQGRAWNPATHTWTYRFVWGAIQVEFAQSGNTLDLNVTATNNSDSNIVFQGATIYPFVLRFPEQVKNFSDPAAAQLAFNTSAPSVTLADFGAGVVAAVVADPSRPLYSGFEPAGAIHSYFPIISSTAMDSLAAFLPHNDRPVRPRDGPVHDLAAVRAFGHDGRDTRVRRVPELVAKQGEDRHKLARSAHSGNGVPGELAGGRSEPAGRLSEQSAALLQRQQARPILMYARATGWRSSKRG